MTISLNYVLCTRKRVQELRGRTSFSSPAALSSLHCQTDNLPGWLESLCQAPGLGGSQGRKDCTSLEDIQPPPSGKHSVSSRVSPLRGSHCLLGPLGLPLEPGLEAGQAGRIVGVHLRNVVLQSTPNLSRHLPFPLPEMQQVLPGLHSRFAGRAGSRWLVQ